MDNVRKLTMHANVMTALSIASEFREREYVEKMGGTMQAITGDHVKELGDEDLRLLVIKLCESELRQAGHPASSILAGGNQTAKDGGIDVRVDLPPTAKEGLDWFCRNKPKLTISAWSTQLQSQ